MSRIFANTSFRTVPATAHSGGGFSTCFPFKTPARALGLLLLAVLLAASGASSAFASVVRLESGSLDFLKGETQVNVEYRYDNLRVSKEDEQTYVNRTVAALNQKEPGRGDRWRVAWVNNRTERFQPKFEELLNQFADRKSALSFGAYKDAKYTLIVQTTSVSLGYNVGVMRYPALINGQVVLVATKDRDQLLATVLIVRSPGRDAWGFDYDAGERLQESYAKAGKELGILIAKKVR